MGVLYLGSLSFGGSGRTFTPPALANYFVFGLVGDASGGSGTTWTSVTWDGLTDAPQSATKINDRECVVSNGSLSALWELHSPDVSGIGTVTYAGGFQNSDDIAILAFQLVDKTDPTYAETTTCDTDPSIDPGWLAGGAKVAVCSHDGTSEAPRAGFTEARANASPRGAIGYRLTDGDVGWTEDASRNATCAACIRPSKLGGGSKIFF